MRSYPGSHDKKRKTKNNKNTTLPKKDTMKNAPTRGIFSFHLNFNIPAPPPALCLGLKKRKVGCPFHLFSCTVPTPGSITRTYASHGRVYLREVFLDLPLHPGGQALGQGAVDAIANQLGEQDDPRRQEDDPPAPVHLSRNIINRVFAIYSLL